MARGKYPLMSNRYPYPREKDPTALKSKDLPGRSQRCWGRKQHPPSTVPHILRVRLKGDDQLAAGFPIPLLDQGNSREGCSAEEPVRIGGTPCRNSQQRGPPTGCARVPGRAARAPDGREQTQAAQNIETEFAGGSACAAGQRGEREPGARMQVPESTRTGASKSSPLEVHVEIQSDLSVLHENRTGISRDRLILMESKNRQLESMPSGNM